MKEWKNINYKGLICDLVFAEKGNWLYQNEEFYSLWIIINDSKIVMKLKDLGFKCFERNIFYLEISQKEAEKLILENEENLKKD